jgi:NitT/TauT family transport system substrate-binding protein
MRRKLAALLSAVALLLAAGCADNGNGNGEPGGPDVIRVGLIPIVDVAPLYLGIEQGFFADRDIELDTSFAAGGAAIIPGVQAGELEIGFSNVISLMLNPIAAGDLRIVSNGNNSTGIDGEDFGALMVPVDSPVTSAAELEGAVIGINTLSNIADTVVRASVRNAGGDPGTIEFTPVEFPDMAGELEAGRIDAAFPVEPFQTIIREEGIGRAVASSWVDAAPDLTVAVYFTSAALLAENPDLISRFVDAMQESLAYANDNPDEVREIIPTYTAVTPELAEILTLPAWPPEINQASVERLAELALGDGILSESPELGTLLP